MTNINAQQFRFILYLDMDGVTASSDYIIKIHDTFVGKQDDENKDFRYRNFMQQWCLQKEAVDCLNAVYDKFPFVIILTSTRRFELTPTEWNTIFRINDVKAYVGGRTNKIPKGNHISWREDEITDYHFKKDSMFNFENIPFIIIDDDSFDLQKYKDKLVNVKTETGLTMDYYDEIIEKLRVQGVQ